MSCSFGLALFEAVDQSNDAIQITGKDSSILVSVLVGALQIERDTCLSGSCVCVCQLGPLRVKRFGMARDAWEVIILDTGQVNEI